MKLRTKTTAWSATQNIHRWNTTIEEHYQNYVTWTRENHILPWLLAPEEPGLLTWVDFGASTAYSSFRYETGKLPVHITFYLTPVGVFQLYPGLLQFNSCPDEVKEILAQKLIFEEYTSFPSKSLCPMTIWITLGLDVTANNALDFISFWSWRVSQASTPYTFPPAVAPFLKKRMTRPGRPGYRSNTQLWP